LKRRHHTQVNAATPIKCRLAFYASRQPTNGRTSAAHQVIECWQSRENAMARCYESALERGRVTSRESAEVPPVEVISTIRHRIPAVQGSRRMRRVEGRCVCR